MMVSALAAVALALPCGCARPTPPVNPAGAGPEMDVHGLEARMSGLASVLSRSGYGLLSDFWHFGAAAEGDVELLELRIDDAARLLLLAIGEDGRVGLDMVVHLPRRDDRGFADDTPRRRAAVELPVAAGEELLIELAIVYGAGRWSLAAFAAPPGTEPPDLRAIFDKDEVARTGEREAAERMRLLGFEPAGKAERLDVEGGRRFVLERSIAAGECAVFAALGSAGIDALALRLRRDGQLIAADPSGRPAAWVAHCAEEDIDLSLELEVSAGDGEVVLPVFGAPRRAVSEWAGPPLQVAALTRDPAAPERALARRLEAAGYDPGLALLEIAHAETGDIHQFGFELAADRCGMLVAAAGPGVRALAVEAAPAGAGRLVSEGGPGPVLLTVCAARGGTVEAALHVAAGAGPVRLVFHPLLAVALPADLGDPPLAIREAAAVFARHEMTAAQTVVPAATPLAPARWTARIDVRPGVCYGIAAASRDDTVIESFRLSDPAGRELARWTGPAAPALIARCFHAAAAGLVLEIIGRDLPLAAERQPPAVVVFVGEDAHGAPLIPAP